MAERFVWIFPLPRELTHQHQVCTWEDLLLVVELLPLVEGDRAGREMIIIDAEGLPVPTGETITTIVEGLPVHTIDLGEITEAEVGATLLAEETILQGDINVSRPT